MKIAKVRNDQTVSLANPAQPDKVKAKTPTKTNERQRPKVAIPESCVAKTPGKAHTSPEAGIYYGISFDEINDDLILSVDSTGKAICHVRDMTWDLIQLKIIETDQTKFSHTQLLSQAPTNEANINTFKKLFLTSCFTHNRNGKAPRVTSMKLDHRNTVGIVKFCDLKEVLITEMISNTELSAEFINQLSKSSAIAIAKLLRNYDAIPSTPNKFKVPKPFIVALKKHIRQIKQSTPPARQHAVIPSRIFQLRWSHYYEALEEFQAHEKSVAQLVTKCSTDPLYAKKAKSDKRDGQESGAKLNSSREFTRALDEHGLKELFAKHSILNIKQVARYLLFIQYCAKCVIHILTLMRDNEALRLPENCIESATGWNEEAIYILGNITKLKGVADPVRWITIEEIQFPLSILLKIADIVRPHLPIHFKNKKYLFLGVGWLPLPAGRQTTKLLSAIHDDLYDKYLPDIFIEEEDLQELELIDFLRDWRAEQKFRLGSRWRISSHQFRRSMSVFCAQHKSMTLPGLKRVLHHLSETTSLHYQKGCSAGVYKLENFSSALIKEMHTAAIDVSNAIYVRDVLYSNERLHGVEGRVVQSQKDSPRFVLREALEALIKQKRKGLLACVETPIGLCVSTLSCDKRAHGDFTTCDGCVHSIIKLSKLDITIQAMEIDLKDFDPKSMEYRMNMQNLWDMKNMRSRLIAKSRD